MSSARRPGRSALRLPTATSRCRSWVTCRARRPPPKERRIEGQKLAINYGFNRVRFPAPVPVGARVRTQSTLKTVEIKGGMVEVMSEIVMEVEGQQKPCCVAESLARYVF